MLNKINAHVSPLGVDLQFHITFTTGKIMTQTEPTQDEAKYELTWEENGFRFKQNSTHIWITTGRKQTVLEIAEIYKHRNTLLKLTEFVETHPKLADQ